MKDFNEYKIKQLDGDNKTSQTLATLAGTTASLATIITIGNFIVGNELVALQNVGISAAMVGYVVGYTRRIKLNNTEKQRITENPDKYNSPKDRLVEMKEKIQHIKNNLGMSTTASIGLGLTTLANMALLAEGNNIAVGAMLLSGTVTALDVLLTSKHIKDLKDTKKRLSLLEDIDEISKQPIPELIESKEDEKRLLK